MITCYVISPYSAPYHCVIQLYDGAVRKKSNSRAWTISQYFFCTNPSMFACVLYSLVFMFFACAVCMGCFTLYFVWWKHFDSFTVQDCSNSSALAMELRQSWADRYTLLTHWGWVMHICFNKIAIIGSDNGLSPGRRQAIIWTNARILLNGLLGTNLSEILIKIDTFSLTKMQLKMPSGKWQLSCLDLNVLNLLQASGVKILSNSLKHFQLSLHDLTSTLITAHFNGEILILFTSLCCHQMSSWITFHEIY